MSGEQEETSQETSEELDQDFIALKEEIKKEYPNINDEELDKTGGDRDLIVNLITKHTNAKALADEKLAKLECLAEEDKAEDVENRRLKAKLTQVQSKLSELAGYTRSQISNGVSGTRSKADEHPLVVLLMALGLGLILGIFVRGFASRDRR